MPVQTQILTRRGTAASWTSTNPTLGAGEIGYETDTGRFKIGTGAAAWASLGYFNRDPLTTKGDLYTFSTTDDRLAVGANGETLVADSSTSTGLRYQASTAAGRNFLINGGMDVAQRGTTFTSVANVYTLDRWYFEPYGSATSANISQGSSDSVTGFRYYAKVAANSATTANFNFGQTIETANTVPLRGKTVTVSFYLRTPVAFTNVFTYSLRYSTSTDTRISNAGTGTLIGSEQTFTPTSSWVRYSATFTIPTDASSLGFVLGTYNNTVATANFDITGVQIELGSVATTFTRAGGTIQGELAACQRYYFRNAAGSEAFANLSTSGVANSTTVTRHQIKTPVTMRVAPSSIDFANLSVNDSVTQTAISGLTLSQSTIDNAVFVTSGATGLTQYRFYYLQANNSTSAYIGFSAEL